MQNNSWILDNHLLALSSDESCAKAKNIIIWLMIVNVGRDKAAELSSDIHLAIDGKEGIEALRALAEFPQFPSYQQLVAQKLDCMSNRIETLNHQLCKQMMPIWRLVPLYKHRDGGWCETAYIMTLRKNRHYEEKQSFEERTEHLRRSLQEDMIEGESLTFENKSFVVHGPQYCITYCLEGYKNTNCRGFIDENGNAKAELLHRIGCSQVMDRMTRDDSPETWGLEHGWKKYTGYHMYDYDLKQKYGNPADRMVSVIEWMRKELAEDRFEKEKWYMLSNQDKVITKGIS